MSDKEFPEGLILKAPRDGAPDYVIGSLSIKRGEFLNWLKGREGDWVNLNLKRATSGKWYAEVDSWKPNGAKGGGTGPTKRAPDPRKAEEVEDDIPFIRCDSAF
ncbi:hypothetical protein [Silanimonas sp.]|jgi:hypothetical protein|uniref:hypothetical protein n=1 Tax=Silanimonas sp. TaxID=1929290 RepID=UPI0022C385A7|nr:hypothetical protein [Silanimonas sp.]MCZ8113852.1 hypothetical protein [Silanimonas sp.]